MKTKTSNINIGDIYFALLPSTSDKPSRVIRETRPVFIISHDHDSGLVTVVPLTTNLSRLRLPNAIYSESCKKPSVILCNTIMTIDENILTTKVGEATDKEIVNIKLAILNTVNVDKEFIQNYA